MQQEDRQLKRLAPLDVYYYNAAQLIPEGSVFSQKSVHSAISLDRLY